MSSLHRAALPALLLLAAAHMAAAGWRTGRGTHYGTDAWSIHQGSCGYGYLDRNVATGWQIAALADTAEDFKGSCGKCKEVRCKAMNFADGYGQWLERTNTCYNTYSSVVVMITDACDCNYAANAFSNKRWCCGDMYHIDLSVWAYEKLAQKKWGVIGVEWRNVPCWYKPRSPAQVPAWTKATDVPSWYKAPAGWAASKDRRYNMGKQFNNYKGQEEARNQPSGFSGRRLVQHSEGMRASQATINRQLGLA